MFFRIIKYACFTLAVLCLAAFAVSCSKKDEGVQAIQEVVEDPNDGYNLDREPGSDDDIAEIPDDVGEEVVTEDPDGEDSGDGEVEDGGDVAGGDGEGEAEDARTEIVGIEDITVKEGLSEGISLGLRNLSNYSGDYVWNYTVGEGVREKISVAWENEESRDRLIITGLSKGSYSFKISAVAGDGREIAGKDVGVVVEEYQPINETAIDGEMLVEGEGKFRLRAVQGSGNFTWEAPQLKEGAADGLELEKIEDGGILKIRIKALKIGDYKISTAFTDNVLGRKYENVHPLKVVEDISVNIYPVHLTSNTVLYGGTVNGGDSGRSHPSGYGMAVVMEGAQGDDYACQIIKHGCTEGYPLELYDDITPAGEGEKRVVCVFGLPRQRSLPPTGVTCSDIHVGVAGAYINGVKTVDIGEFKFEPGPLDAPLKLRVVDEQEDVLDREFMPKDASGYIVDSTVANVKRGHRYTATIEVVGGTGQYTVDVKNNKPDQTDCDNPEDSGCYAVADYSNPVALSGFSIMDSVGVALRNTATVLTALRPAGAPNPKQFTFAVQFPMRRLNTELKITVRDDATGRTITQVVKFDTSECYLWDMKHKEMKLYVLYENGWGDGDNDTSSSTTSQFFLFTDKGDRVAKTKERHLDGLNGTEENDYIDDCSQEYTVRVAKAGKPNDQICLEDITTVEGWFKDFSDQNELPDIKTRKILAASCSTGPDLKKVFSGDKIPESCMFADWDDELGMKDIDGLARFGSSFEDAPGLNGAKWSRYHRVDPRKWRKR